MADHTKSECRTIRKPNQNGLCFELRTPFKNQTHSTIQSPNLFGIRAPTVYWSIQLILKSLSQFNLLVYSSNVIKLYASQFVGP